MSGIARLFDLNEALEFGRMMESAPPPCELDHRIMVGLKQAIPWLESCQTRCTMCDSLLGGHAAFVVVLLPIDPEQGFGASGGVCGSCGGLPRIALEAQATRMAILMFEPHQGRA